MMLSIKEKKNTEKKAMIKLGAMITTHREPQVQTSNTLR